MIILLVVFKYIFKRSMNWCLLTKRASSTGEFKRNNIFEILENETVSDLIKYSGEFNSLAYKNEVYMERIDGINKNYITRKR